MTEYFPTAKQAREYTNGIINNKLSEVYAELKEQILAAANKGEACIYYYKHLPQPVINRLITLGYNIDCENNRNEVYYVITWGEE